MLTTVYTFRESAPGRSLPPAYVELCMSTWQTALPHAEIVRISHRTMADFVGDAYDLELLKRFPLASQSDAIAVAVLHRHGGLFMDADTILTGAPLPVLDSSPSNTLTMFGRPGQARAHMAFLHSGTPEHSFLEAWLVEVQRRLSRFSRWRSVPLMLTGLRDSLSPVRRLARLLGPAGVKWNYLGNGILNPLLAGRPFDADVRIFDRTRSGFILESAFSRSNDPTADYLDFYFTNRYSADEVLARNTCGVIGLHSSLTPRAYKLASRDDVLSTDNLLSDILRKTVR